METLTADKQEMKKNTDLADFNLPLQAYNKLTTQQNNHIENFNTVIIVLQVTDVPQTW